MKTTKPWRWAMTVAALSGKPAPPLPQLPGRLCAGHAHDDEARHQRELEAARAWQELETEGGTCD